MSTRNTCEPGQRKHKAQAQALGQGQARVQAQAQEQAQTQAQGQALAQVQAQAQEKRKLFFVSGQTNKCIQSQSDCYPRWRRKLRRNTAPA